MTMVGQLEMELGIYNIGAICIDIIILAGFLVQSRDSKDKEKMCKQIITILKGDQL